MRLQPAFTLVEILIVLFIMVILSIISLPGLKTFLVDNKENLLRQQLLRSIEWARQESQAKRMTVALCSSKDHLTCSGQWIEGQLIFSNEDEDGVVHEKEDILAVLPSHQEPGFFNQNILYWRSYPRYRQYVLCRPTGFSRCDNGTFWYCRSHEPLPAWAIMLSQTGKTRVAYPDQNGLIKDTHGKALQCKE